MAEKVKLTDRKLRSLKAAPAGKRIELLDTEVPGFGARATDKGTVTFFLRTRFPGSDQTPRRAIGEFPALSLEQARSMAAEWRLLIKRGIDPREEQAKVRAAEKQKRANTFGTVAEEYITRKIAKTAKARASELEIRNELMSRWGDLPITEITRRDVVAMAEEIGERAPYQAHNVFGHCRALFNWAIARGLYGVETSPCDQLKATDLIGAKQARSRVLTDQELRALWTATETLDYPYGPLIRLLAITGQRKSEVAEARWGEFDLAARRWTIPAHRMKAAAAHVVPLSGLAIEVLQGLPRFARADCLFTTTDGAKSVDGFSKAKERLDRAIATELGAAPPPFVLHDIRRTVRTRLSGLNVSSDVAELVIAHTRPGLRRVYDLHSFEDEKLRALERWADRLAVIVCGRAADVMPLYRT